jgi:hypothetical protein
MAIENGLLPAEVPTVDERLHALCDDIERDAFLLTKAFPGLVSLLRDELDPKIDVSGEDFTRSLLKVLKDSEVDDTYQNLLAEHTPDERKLIEAFVDGGPIGQVAGGFELGPSKGVRQELEKLHDAKEVVLIEPEGMATPTLPPSNAAGDHGLTASTVQTNGDTGHDPSKSKPIMVGALGAQTLLIQSRMGC